MHPSDYELRAGSVMSNDFLKWLVKGNNTFLKYVFILAYIFLFLQESKDCISHFMKKEGHTKNLEM